MENVNGSGSGERSQRQIWISDKHTQAWDKATDAVCAATRRAAFRVTPAEIAPQDVGAATQRTADAYFEFVVERLYQLELAMAMAMASGAIPERDLAGLVGQVREFCRMAAVQARAACSHKGCTWVGAIGDAGPAMRCPVCLNHTVRPSEIATPPPSGLKRILLP